MLRQMVRFGKLTSGASQNVNLWTLFDIPISRLVVLYAGFSRHRRNAEDQGRL